MMWDRWLHFSRNFLALLVLVSLPFSSKGVRNDFGLPPGPYCANLYDTGRCCEGRQDDCGVPILSTVCYCDEFCVRSDDDCCPDYWRHCKGFNETAPEPLRRCFYQGKEYNHGQTFKDNCNVCKCSSLNERAEVLCEKNRCLIEKELMEELYHQPTSWREANYSQFWGRTLDEGIKLRTGTLNPSGSVYRMNPVKRIYDPNNLPRELDGRRLWPRFISKIQDQGWCGASWAISTVDVASDRYGIMSKGFEDVSLSAQHLLSCNNRGQQGCNGGYLDRAWLFMRRFGLVDEDCYPWTGRNDVCRLKKRTNLRDASCRQPENQMRKELYKVGPAYRLGNETDIMQEILTSGPVQATMKVYQDFFVYKTGIYEHSSVAEIYPTGYHSVRIIGWGEENRIKYWIVANSWGESWGENGYFRIRKGVNECEIETFVLAVWAKTKM